MRKPRKTQRTLRALAAAFSPRDRVRWAKVFLNTECNLRCAYCAVPDGRKAELALEEWQTIYRTLREWGVAHISILGGEPTLRADLEDHIGFLSSLGILTSVTTNGVLLTSGRLRRLAMSGLDCLQVSLDAMTTKRLPKRDFAGAFELLETATACGVLPVVSCVITAHNIEEVPLLAETVLRRGFLFSFSPYQDIGHEFSRKIDALRPSQEGLQDVAGRLLALKHETGRVLNTKKYLLMLRDGQGQQWKCSQEHDLWIAVDSEGYLMRCHEHKSPFRVVEVPSVDGPLWDTYRRDTVRQCAGCSYHCYFDAEEIRGVSFLKEARTVASCLRSSR